MVTLGGFRLYREGAELPPVAFRREKALHLFQFLLTERRQPLHKEAIVDRLWPELEAAAADRDFKVALNALLAVIEPGRSARQPFRHVRRVGLAYALDTTAIALDAEELEAQVARGNALLKTDEAAAISAYAAVDALYAGEYLPERRFEDWAGAERERLQTLALSTLTRLSGLLLARAPLESLRLARRVLAADPGFEDAYRLEMRAHAALGNRALALRAYRRCAEHLRREYGVEPLPDTTRLARELERSAPSATGL